MLLVVSIASAIEVPIALPVVVRDKVPAEFKSLLILVVLSTIEVPPLFLLPHEVSTLFLNCSVLISTLFPATTSKFLVLVDPSESVFCKVEIFPPKFTKSFPALIETDPPLIKEF
jgi:hypothetical protein